MLRFIILLNYFYSFIYSVNLPEGYFLDIDGISISLTNSNICSIESKPGVQIGGNVICWGYDGRDILNTPKNV